MTPDIFSVVKTPSTCVLDWDHAGIEQKRWFCSHCQHHVHNLSAMTRRQAKKFLARNSGTRQCISFLQEDDGRAVFKPGPRPLLLMRAILAFMTSAILVLFEIGCNKILAQNQSVTTSASPSPNPPPSAASAANALSLADLCNPLKKEKTVTPPWLRPSERGPVRLKTKRWTGF